MRFNINIKTGHTVSYDRVNNDAYLSERFRLFDAYSFPSLSRQTNSNFTWLLLFNDQLPEKWRKINEDYCKKCPNLKIYYLPPIYSSEWRDVLNTVIANELDGAGITPQYVLTTRIDNDDAFHISFVDSIQHYFLEHQQEALINYVNGLQYIPKYNVLKNTVQPNGHFGTLIEINSPNLQTVLSFGHNNLTPLGLNVVNLDIKKRMWVEVIHDTNVFNTPWFRLSHLFEDLFFIGFKFRNLKEFGIAREIPRFNLFTWKVFFEWLRKSLVRNKKL